MKPLIPLEDMVPGYAAENTGPITEGAMTVNQPLLCVTVDHATSILVIPVAQDQRSAQRPSVSAPSAGLVGMQSGEGPW